MDTNPFQRNGLVSDEGDIHIKSYNWDFPLPGPFTEGHSSAKSYKSVDFLGTATVTRLNAAGATSCPVPRRDMGLSMAIQGAKMMRYEQPAEIQIRPAGRIKSTAKLWTRQINININTYIYISETPLYADE